MTLKNDQYGPRSTEVCGGHSRPTLATAGTKVKVLGRATWAETSMGSNKSVVLLPNGNRIVVDTCGLKD
jgi:hypothetical protein